MADGEGQRHGHAQVSRLSSTYFRGLNYLLSEQPDKAIELFQHIAELDKETFETQVALGHLFRRRGEIDRAIRLHQGLFKRPDLTDHQKGVCLTCVGRGLHEVWITGSCRDSLHRTCAD